MGQVEICMYLCSLSPNLHNYVCMYVDALISMCILYVNICNYIHVHTVHACTCMYSEWLLSWFIHGQYAVYMVVGTDFVSAAFLLSHVSAFSL